MREVLAARKSLGVGKVYRATDTKLNRDVALKVLPQAFTDDPDRLRSLRARSQGDRIAEAPHRGRPRPGRAKPTVLREAARPNADDPSD